MKVSKIVSGSSSAKLMKSPRRIFSTIEAGIDGSPPPGANPTLTSSEDVSTAPGERPERVPAEASPTNVNNSDKGQAIVQTITQNKPPTAMDPEIDRQPGDIITKSQCLMTAMGP